MNTVKLLALAALPTVVLASLAACASDNFANGQGDGPTPEPTATETPDAAPTATVPPSVVNGGACSNARLPTEDACVVNDVFGVFVSSTKGNDASGDGTRAKPFATIKRAIAAAAPTRKRVYACNERFTESVALADGVSMFGYLDCARDWAITPAVRADVVAPASPALTAASLGAATRVEGFSFTAPAGSVGAPSSIGFTAVDVADLALVNVRIVANDARDGASGVEPPQPVNSGSLGGNDNVAAEKCAANSLLCRAAHSGRAGGTNDCGGAAGVSGGAGGSGGFGGIYSVVPGPPGGPPKVVSTTEAPGMGDALTPTTVTAQGGTAVKGGTNGANGANGANGVSSKGGVITASGYTPGDGTAGTSGAPGQGGGGGAGVPVLSSSDVGTWFGSPGAGGGAGGCPGLAGTAGKGGGASIGGISFSSKLRFDHCVIEVGRGGNGGRGTFGSTHTTGGLGGANASGQAPAGAGWGGDGGRSGVSGHGAGGPSLGIAHKGGAPTLDIETKAAIKLGAPGGGRAGETFNGGGESKTLDASPAGFVSTVFPVP